MNTKSWLKALAALALGGAIGSANAAVLWENSAGKDLGAFNPTTGAQLKNYSASQDKGNGRGIVVVGNTVYYTVANSNQVYTLDATTGLNIGVAFSVAGTTGLATISFDGTNFWVGDYSGTNKAYKYSPAGVLLNTISLINCEGFCDGLEYFNGKLISNRYDGGFARAGGNTYDIYDLNGVLLTPGFIVTAGHGNGTGIAFDGTNFYVSDIFNNRATIWSGTTGAFIGAVTFAGSHGAVEDLSFDFADRGDTCGGPNQPPCVGKAPEPSDMAIFGLGLVGLTVFLRRRQKRA